MNGLIGWIERGNDTYICWDKSNKRFVSVKLTITEIPENELAKEEIKAIREKVSKEVKDGG